MTDSHEHCPALTLAEHARTESVKGGVWRPIPLSTSKIKPNRQDLILLSVTRPDVLVSTHDTCSNTCIEDL